MRYGTIGAAIVFLLLTAPIPRARGTETQNDARIVTAAPAEGGYPDTTSGLQELLDDMGAAARAGDSARLRVVIASTEIPNYQIWFVKTFGEANGARWAANYGRTRRLREAELQNEMMQLAQRPGYFSAKEIVPTDMYDTIETPVDLFLGNWSPPDVDGLKRRRTPIGYFFYIRGKFCWNSEAIGEGR